MGLGAKELSIQASETPKSQASLSNCLIAKQKEVSTLSLGYSSLARQPLTSVWAFSGQAEGWPTQCHTVIKPKLEADPKLAKEKEPGRAWEVLDFTLKSMTRVLRA